MPIFSTLYFFFTDNNKKKNQKWEKDQFQVTKEPGMKKVTVTCNSFLRRNAKRNLLASHFQKITAFAPSLSGIQQTLTEEPYLNENRLFC